MTDRVLAQIAALAKASLPDLKAQYRDLFGVEAPVTNRSFLERRIAYRLQELAYGGLSQATQAPTGGLSPDRRQRLFAPQPDKTDRPLAGTRLLRVWNGVEHSVTVLQTGFEYRGRPFASLSAIAREITKTSWNGPAFFGLREKRL